MPTETRLPVAKLTAAQRIDQVFMISQPQLRTTTRGDYYIAAFLSDSTGKLNGRMWQASEAIFESLPQEGFARVKGRTENYQGNLQLVIDGIQPVDSAQVEMQEFVPSTDKDIDGMFTRLQKALQAVQEPHLRALMDAFLKDAPLMDRFKAAPAAKAMHHAYLGGLLEHTLGLVELGVAILPIYPQLDKDLVLTALFLHDIGKTDELVFDVSFQYSDEGHFLGHLVQGALLIEKRIDQLNLKAKTPFPTDLRNRLLHIIVSHHGLKEYGCPVMPSTPEAFVVHHLDNLDAKIALTFNEIEKDPGAGSWTNYIRSIESYIYKLRPSQDDNNSSSNPDLF